MKNSPCKHSKRHIYQIGGHYWSFSNGESNELKPTILESGHNKEFLFYWLLNVLAGFLTEAQIANGNNYLPGHVSLLALTLTTATIHCLTVKVH